MVPHESGRQFFVHDQHLPHQESHRLMVFFDMGAYHPHYK